MRTLIKNEQVFYYALYEGEEEIIDEYGNETGTYEVVYSNPIEAKANISSAKGETAIELFGESEDYDRAILYNKGKYPIDEHSVLWIDTMPEIKEDGSTDSPYDYKVDKVSTSLNNTVVAIHKVDISA